MEGAFCAIHGTDRVGFVERGGSKLAQVLEKKNPFGKANCNRADCWMCASKEEKEW